MPFLSPGVWELNDDWLAESVLLGNQKKKSDGVISEKVSRSYRMWHERLIQAVRIAMPVDDPYVVAHTDSLVGLFSCIFVRQRQRHLLRDSAITSVKRGMGGRYGNKVSLVDRIV
jgi:Endonuclease/Exonuclease/phosphatase family 2